MVRAAGLSIAVIAAATLSGAQGAETFAGDVFVVTAERRAQSIDEAPASISVIGESVLERIDADHVSEALARAPGVFLHRGSGAEHLTAIRSPVLTGGAGAGSFLFLENGVPLRAAGFANVNGLLDAHFEIADRIEIVRGPSGPLYGANAIHGVINLFTPDPDAAPRFAALISGDTEDRYKWRAETALRSGDHAFYAGLSAVSESGYREEAGLDTQKGALRHRYERGAIDLDTIVSFVNIEQETAGFIFGRETLFDRAARRQNAFPFAYRDAKSFRAQTGVTITLSESLRFSTTPYGRWNEMAFPQHFLPSNALETNGHWTIGAQNALYFDRGPLSLIAGVDLAYSEGRLREFQEREDIFSFTQGLHYDYEVRSSEVSGFGQASYAFDDATRATIGIRIDATLYDYDNNAPDGVVGRFLRPADRSDRFVTASPKFSLERDLAPNLVGYASLARGARPPQTTDLYRLQVNQTGGGARPEIIDAAETGLRLSLADRARASLAGYFMEKRNFFFRDADGFNVPNGRTRHVGAELDLSIDVTDRLTLSSAIAYGRHTYRFSRETGSATETIRFGDDVDTAPRILATTSAFWRPRERLSLSASWRVVGGYFTDAANAHRYDGHHVLDVRAEAALTDSLTLALSMRNVGDRLYAERADFAFGRERFFPAEVRTLGFALRYRAPDGPAG